MEKVYKDDQSVRQFISQLSELSIDELIQHYEMMHLTDSINQTIVSSILDNEGWPSNLSKEANKGIFLVIDHADTEYQQKYIDLVRNAAESGTIAKADYATLYDRVMMHLGNPQRYGSQTYSTSYKDDDTTIICLYLWPVEDAIRLDSLRESVGMSPIQDYLMLVKKTYGSEVIWDKDKTVDDFKSQFINDDE